MRTFDLIAILIVMAAVFSYINVKVLKLPTAIGLMALTLLFSVAVFVAGLFFPDVEVLVKELVSQFDFNEALLHGMLGFLLFAGRSTSTSETLPGTAGRLRFWPRWACCFRP